MESEYAKMGSLTKQGNVRKNWKRRVFCLTSNGVLNYHKDPLKQPLGSIDIKQTCIGILDGHKCRCPWPASVPKENCFGIVTSGRVFHVYADSSDDADAWMKALAGVSTALKSQQSFDEMTSTDDRAMYGNVPDATGDDGAEESDDNEKIEYEDFAKEDDEDAYTTVPATSRQAPRLPPRYQPKDAAIVDDKAEQVANSESLYESIPAEDKDVVLNPVYGDVGNAIPATSSSPPPPPLPPPSDDVVYEDVAETRRQADALTKTAATTKVPPATIASEEIHDEDEIYEVVAEDDKKAATEVPSTPEELYDDVVERAENEDEIYEVVTEEATANSAAYLDDEKAATIEEVASEEIYDDVVVERENEDEIYDVVIEEATARNASGGGDDDDESNETAAKEVLSSSQKPDDVVAEVDEQETNEEIYDDVAETVAQNAASDDDDDVAYEVVSGERDEPVAEEESLDEEDGKSPLEQQPVVDTSESPSQSSAEPVTVAATADESESAQQRKRLETLPRDLPVQPIASRETHRSVQNIGKRLRQTKSMAEPETTTPLVDRPRMRSSSAKRQRLFKAGSKQTRRDEKIRHSKAMEEEAARQVAELKAIQEKIMKRRSGVGEETKQTSSDETASSQKEEEGEKSSEEKQSKTEDKDSKQQSIQEATDAPGAGIAPGEQTSLKSDVVVDKREGREDSKKKDDGDDAVAQNRVESTEPLKPNVDQMPTQKETAVRSSTKPPIKPRPPHLSSSTGGGGWAKAKVKMSAVSAVQQQLEKWEKMRMDMIDAEKKRHTRRAEEEKRRRQERIETAKREREAMEKKANEERAQRAQKRELQTREKQQKLEQEKREQEEKERRRQKEEQKRREKLKREQEKEKEERRKREEEERERQRQKDEQERRDREEQLMKEQERQQKEEQERRDREEQQRKEQQQQQKEEQERIEQLRREELQKKEREESERREKEEREKREQLQREQEMRKREEQEKREEQQRREREEREKKPVSMDDASSKRDKVDGFFAGVEEDLSQLEEMMRKRKAELAKEGTPTGQSSSETKKPPPPPRPLSKAESPAIASEKKAYSPAASASPTNVSEAKPPAAGGKKPLFPSKLPVTNSEEKPAVPAKPLASTPSSESQISQKPVEPPARVIQEKPSSPPKPVVSVSAPEEKSAVPAKPPASTPSSEASDAKEKTTLPPPKSESSNDSSEQKPGDQTEKSSSQTVPQVQTTDNYDAPLRFSDAEIRKKKEMARKRASLLSWPSTDVPEDPLGETEGLSDDDPRLSRKLSVVATGKNAQTRALAAAKWIDKELRKLVAEMTNWGSRSVEGLYEVTFGLLFEETANIFEALSGTLKTAKKHGIVKFAGELLLQGVHDRTVITLVKDTIPDSTAETYTYREFRACSIAVNKRKGKGFGKTSQQNQQNKCFICTKTVYPMEYIGVDDKALHKTCFKCLECKKLLSLGNYAAMDNKFYCKTHYERLYKKRGSYGF